MDHFLEVVRGLGLQSGVLATKLESMWGVELLTKTLSMGCGALPQELTGCLWSAVAELLPKGSLQSTRRKWRVHVRLR